MGLIREAFTACVPLLTMLFNLVGILGAWLVCVKFMGLDGGVFIDKVRWYVDVVDIRQGLIKALIFGFTIALIACRQGFFAEAGRPASGGQPTARSSRVRCPSSSSTTS